MGQHGQRDVPIPALPVAPFVGVQPAFAFSCLQAWFDQPALSSHSDQRFKRVFPDGSVTQIVSALWLLFEAAPHQKPPEPNHPVSTIASTPNHRAVRPCCRNRRKGASMQMRANSAPLHPPEVA